MKCAGGGSRRYAAKGVSCGIVGISKQNSIVPLLRDTRSVWTSYPNTAEATVSDEKWMKLAIKAAESSQGSKSTDPLVGAVLVRNGELIGQAYRGEKVMDDHAEFTLLQKKLRSTELTRGATLYATLEPCTTRGHQRRSCAKWIIEKGIRRVVIGILDPNPAICGQGYWELRDAGIEVDLFPSALAQQIEALNSRFLRAQRGEVDIGARFARMLDKLRHRTISPYAGSGLVIGSCIALQSCSDLRRGWSLDSVQMRIARDAIRIPRSQMGRYRSYFKRMYEANRFSNDGEKFGLVINPTAFSDGPDLELKIASTCYSRVLFYVEEIATQTEEREKLVRELVQGSLAAGFPNSLCMHAVVITTDGFVLRTLRSKKVKYKPNTWSVSAEEQLARKDFSPRKTTGTCAAWGARLLEEELGLGKSSYSPGSFTVQSVFLDAESFDIALCAIVKLRLTREELSAVLRARPRTDYEFADWDFLELSPSTLLSELTSPTKLYHPTSPFRLLHTFIKQFGAPSDEAISKILDA